MPRLRAYKLRVEHDSIFEDGKRIPTIKALCQECGAEEAIKVNKLAGDLPDSMIVKKFQQKGWVVDRAHALCPLHSGKPRRQSEPLADKTPIKVHPLPDFISSGYEIDRYLNRGQTFGVAEPTPQPEPEPQKEEPMATPAARSLADLGEATVRIMDRPTRRRVFDTISGVWDDSKGRYYGNNSDQSLADDLKVPRAWVREVREEMFGDSGENAELDEFRTELNSRISQVEKLRDDALKLAENFDVQVAGMKELRRRLERVESHVLPKR